ncbi:hypothetical protein FRC03_008696 [Tulasnella sp. 419]|nr:hypothetical protein FRC03_008696 [Tulasnella sp. 419]
MTEPEPTIDTTDEAFIFSDEAFIVSAVPDQFIVGDPIDQQQQHATATQPILSERGETLLRHFTSKAPESEETKRLRQRFERSTGPSLLNQLNVKKTINFEEDTVHRESPYLFFDQMAHYMDAICVVGKSLGLGYLISPSRSYLFSMTLKIKQSHKQFKDKHGRLGFDPTGRGYFLGNVDQESIWLLFKPDNPEEVVPPAEARGTALSQERSWQFGLFLAYLLQKLPHTNVLLFGAVYSECSSEEEFQALTNLMDKHTDNPLLDSRSAQMFNDLLVEEYVAWAENAPWIDDDPFFLRTRPIGVAVLYGQDSRMDSPEDRRAFAKKYDWSEVEYFTYAIASTLRARYTKDFELTDAACDQVLYDSPDRSSRRKVNVHSSRFPVNARTLPLYNRHGEVVPVVQPRFPRDRPAECGIVLDLNQIKEQIKPFGARLDRDGDAYMNDCIEEEEFRRKAQTYTIGGLRGIGNVQADGALNYYHKFISRVHTGLSELFDDPRQAPPVIVEVVFHQIYNEIAHKTRGMDGKHDVGRGLMTIAMAGHHLTDKAAKTKQDSAEKECNKRLPAEIYENKVKLCPPFIGNRFETVQVVHVQRLPPQHQTGRIIFDKIVAVGCDLYEEEGTMDEITKLVKVFKPGVEFIHPRERAVLTIEVQIWPDIILWNTAPVVEGLRSLWEHYQSIKKPGVVIPWHVVELTSMFERLLLHLHTGSGKVLPGGLLKALGVKTALRQTALPAFTKLLNVENGYPSIEVSEWPEVEAGPLLNSQASIKYAYGEEVALVSTDAPTIHSAELAALVSHTSLICVSFPQAHVARVRLDVIVRRLYSDSEEPDEYKIAAYLIRYLVETLLSNAMSFAIDGLTTVLKQRTPNSVPERRELNQQRIKLKQWKDSKYAWASDDGLVNILYIITDRETDAEILGLPMSKPPTFTFKSLGDEIAKCVLYSGHKSWLYQFGGSFKSTCPRILESLREHTSYDNKTILAKIPHIAKTVLDLNRVFFLPGYNVLPDGTATEQLGVSHWMTAQPAAFEAPAPTQQTRFQQAVQSSQAVSQFDPSLQWSALQKDSPLTSLTHHVLRINAPRDLKFDNAIKSASSSLKDLLEQAAEAFSMANPIHAVGFWTAVVVSRMLPHIKLQMPTEKYKQAVHRSHNNFIVDKSSWILSGSTGGLTNGPEWVAVFVLAWVIYWEDFDGATSQQTEPYSLLIDKIRAKGINARFWIKVGLAETVKESTRLVSNAKGGRYGADWKLKSKQELLDRHKMITGLWPSCLESVILDVVGNDGYRRLGELGRI